MQLIIYLRIRLAVNLDESTIFVTNSQLYPDPFGLESDKKEPKFEVTWRYYDQVRWMEQNKKMFLPILVVAAIHWYTNAPTPLILVSMTQTLQAYQHQLFQIYILGKDASLVRILKRPWPNPPSQMPFGKNGYFGKHLKSMREDMEKYEAENNPDKAAPVKKIPRNRKKARKLK